MASTETRIDQEEKIVQQPSTGVEVQLNRRSHMEIFCDILRAIGSGAEKPTHIMYKANLSWEVMQSYLKTLQSQELIIAKTSDERRIYRLSEKGYEILKQFVSIREDLNL